MTAEEKGHLRPNRRQGPRGAVSAISRALANCGRISATCSTRRSSRRDGIAASFNESAAHAAHTSTEAKSRRLSFKGLGAKVATQMLGQVGEKALAPSGASVVGQKFKPDPVALGEPVLSVLHVVSVVQHATPSSPTCARPPRQPVLTPHQVGDLGRRCRAPACGPSRTGRSPSTPWRWRRCSTSPSAPGWPPNYVGGSASSG